MGESTEEGFGALVKELCVTNMELWKEEDKARVENDLDVAKAKRNIDKLNQRRNNLVEQIDDYLLKALENKGVEANG